MYIFPKDKQQTENSGILFLFMIFAVDFLQGDEGRDKGKVKTS